ncbi:hypothetical protein GQ53DRAFT_846628 [Thozetella sp. PMI_491]|nr:hypothetical protein GQ53DRAFT_846628 [Thozetella sp. PMI_491]
MPYSDNLYSIVDDDSDAEIEHPLYHTQQQGHSLAGQAETPQPWRLHGGEVPGADRDAHMDHYLVEDEETGADEDVLSPTDGYFHGNSSSTLPTSSNVPHVPNVWVHDPSLQESTADSKAREAHQEALASRRLLNTTSATSDEDPPFFGTQDRGASLSVRTAATSASGHHYTHPSATHTPYASVDASTAYTPSQQDQYQYHYYPSASASGPSSSAGATHSRQSSSSAYTPSAPSSYRTYTPRRPTYGRRQPSPVPSEAPPAYTPSPTSPTPSDPASRHYSTFPSPTAEPRSPAAVGREETQGLLAGRPESMGNPGDEFEGITPVWKDRVRRRLPVFSSRTCRNILVGIVLFLIALGFLSSFFTAVRQEKQRQDAESPVRRPNIRPPMEYPIDNDDASWGTDTCKGDQIPLDTQWFPVSFGKGRSLSIKQDIQDDEHNSRDVRISGDIILRRSGPDTPSPSIAVDVVVNDQRIQVATGWDSEQQHLLLTVGRGLPWDSHSPGPCVRIRITAWVPENGVLDGLSIEDIHLGVKLMDNLRLDVQNSISIKTTVGSIVASTGGADDEGLKHRGSPESFMLKSRYVEVKTVSAPIRGAWPLYDYLSISSTSGSIHVGIEPKEASAEDPKPAILYIKSLSGTLEFYEPIEVAKTAFALSQVEDQALDQTMERAEKYLPPRDYRVDVHSTSGSVKGSLAFSTACLFHSTSGTTAVDLLPVLDKSMAEGDSRKATLSTSTTSGSTTIELYDPLWVNSDTASYIRMGVVPGTPSLPSGKDGLGEGDDVTLVPIGRVGNDDPYTRLPDVGNDNGANGPVITGARPSTGRREVVTDINAAANIAAQFEKQATSKQEASDVAWRSLVSQHSTTSASLRLHYPASWEGSIDLSVLSGEIVVVGDVHDIKYGDAWPGVRKEFHAIKGPRGGGSVTARTTSGDIKLTIGDKDKKRA